MEAPKLAATPAPGTPSEGRGPRDDFYCWKYRIWYASEDCIYRHANRTYVGCVGCFQGRMNLRHVERGLTPPIIIPAVSRDARAPASPPAPCTCT
jgi:hypothetical protein